MKIIVDSNIIISALIRDSITRKIIIQCDDILLSPEIVIAETKKHIDMISQKSGLSPENIENTFNILIKYIHLIPYNEMEDFIPEARKIMEKIDPTDTIFIAAALSKNAAIWSNDKDFQKQDKVRIFTTENMIKRVLK